jgi:hypothetical protein
MPSPDGASLRDHLEVLRDAGVEHPLLNKIHLPPGSESLWSIFWSLNTGRQNYGFGPCRISWSDMLAWCQLNQYRLAPWEVSILKTMDDAFVSTAMKELESRGSRS